MCHILMVLLGALVAAAAADGDAGSPYPAAPNAGVATAAAALPYPHAQAQDSYDADAQYAQQPTYEGAYYLSQGPAYPGLAPAIAKAEAVAVAVKALAWVASNAAAAVVGSVLALAVCKLTPLCSLLASKWRAHAHDDDARALVAPALNVLRAAVAKYAPKNA